MANVGPISPITGSNNITLIQRIPSEKIIEKYRKNLSINIEKYFKHVKHVSVYRCNDSGYNFYYPFSVIGKGDLYEKLSKYSWYYNPWKWEHRIAYENVNSNQCILEIGCGHGSFLKKVADKGCNCTGLELGIAKSFNLSERVKILKHDIHDHRLKNYQKYDVVCMFQTLEHIAKVKQVMQDIICLTKKGGRIIISVPNNDSLIFKEYTENELNLPPHHMGLWSITSLLSLQKYFPIRIEQLLCEPLQDYHFEYLASSTENKYSIELDKSYIPFKRKVFNLSRHVIRKTCNLIKEYIPGHTVMIIAKTLT